MPDPHSYYDPNQARISHIDFVIKVDFVSSTLHLQSAYTMHTPVEGALFLDTRDLEIHRIHSGGKELNWELDLSDPILGQRLHIKDMNAIASFTIESTTTPESSALQWLNPELTAGGQHPYLYSQCQAIHARSIFACQDSPVVRLTYSADVILPKPLVAVMAAASIGSRDEGSKTRYRFEMPQAIPSYLFAIAAGNIKFRSLGIRCGVYAEPEILEAAAWEFAKTEEILAKAENLFGPYAWDRYDILVLPPAFPYGGMENPRLTFISPVYLVGDRSETIIVTHELAHAWTGNLITNATWEDFWLNEGWTTYAEIRITEALEGREYAQFRSALGRDYMFEDMQHLDSDPALTALFFPMQGLDPDLTTTTIPYHKGNAFLTHLEETVGRKKFDAFIKTYIDTYRFTSLSTQQFITFLEEKLGEDIRDIDIDTWLYEPGFPEFAPVLNSRVYENIFAKAAAFANGDQIVEADIAGWKPAEVTLFLRLLPKNLEGSSVRYLEALFNIKESKNATILTSFYVNALQSDYAESLPRIERFTKSIGRSFLVTKIFRAMLGSNWARNEARRIFESAKAHYHPITISNIEEILAAGGL